MTEKRIAIMRTSDRSSFKRCRRKWNWSSPLRENRTLKDNPSYFWIGTGGHFAMEDYHGYNHFLHPVEAFNAYVTACKEAQRVYGYGLPDDWEEQTEMAHGILNHYLIWAQNRDTYKTAYFDGVPQVEITFHVPLPFAPPPGFHEVVYQFTLDRLVEIEGEYWILDWKYFKTFSQSNLEYDQQLCVPTDTEILTRAGWKTYNTLGIGEEVLGYNQEKDCLEWTKLLDIHHTGMQDTVKYSNRSFEFVSTPQHKWVQRLHNKNKTVLEPIVVGKSDRYVIMSSTLDMATNDITPNEARVIAWLLTDGSIGSYTRGLRASIGQSRKKYANTIQILLDTFDNAYTRITEVDDTVTWHLAMDFFRALWDKAGLELDFEGWEEFVLGMSDEARQAFCGSAMEGDGSLNGTFYQNLGIKQDIFKLAFFLTGKFPGQDKICGQGDGFANSGKCRSFSVGTPHKWIKTIESKPVGKQDTWCPQTALGTWVMKQNNQITITGNSAYIWAAQACFDVPIAGGILHEFRKAIPNQPKFLSSGKLSTSKTQGTTHGLYREAMINLFGSVDKAPRANITCLNDMAMQENEDRDNFIKRTKTRRTQAQLEAEGSKILMELEDMCNPDLPLYTNPTKDCSWDCQMQDICLMVDRADDWEFALNETTVPRTTEAGNWRGFLKWPNEKEEDVLSFT